MCYLAWQQSHSESSHKLKLKLIPIRPVEFSQRRSQVWISSYTSWIWFIPTCPTIPIWNFGGTIEKMYASTPTNEANLSFKLFAYFPWPPPEFRTISKMCVPDKTLNILIQRSNWGCQYTPSLSPKIQTFLITFAGKSLWLTVLLILRVHARLPTLYINLPHNMYTSLMTRASSNLNVQHTEPDWDEITSKRHTTLPTETWALIDSSSNQCLISVPPAYQTNYFVVQAAFPRCEEG